METELARIYVPTCCCDTGKRAKERARGTEKERGREGHAKGKGMGKAVLGALAARLGCWKASARRCSLTLGFLHLDTYSAVGYLHLLTRTWVLTLGYLQLDTC